ncbi:MAG: hypothetical protein U0X71_07070, partial [Sphingobacteriaceae bacterium]
IVGGSGSATVSGTGLIMGIKSGTVTLTVTSSGDTNYLLTNISQGLTIIAGPQTLTISSTNTLAVGQTLQASVTSTATSSSGGTLSYSIVGGSGSATVSGTGLITGIESGTVTLMVTSSGDTNYLSTNISQVLTIMAGPQTLTISSTNTLAVGQTLQASVTSTATSSSGGTLSYSIVGGSGSATVNPNTGLITGIQVGTVTLTVNSTGDTNYASASVSQLVTVSIGAQSLSIVGGPLSVSVGTAIAISTTRSVTTLQGGSLSYTLVAGSGSATIDPIAGTIIGTRVGTITVIVTALGNPSYYASISTTQSVSVTIGTQTLVINNQPISLTVGSTLPISVTRSVLASLGGGLTYSLAPNSLSASIDASGNLTGIHVGAVTLTVTALGNTNYYSPVSSTVVATINRGSQTLVFTSSSNLLLNGSMTASVKRANTNGSNLPFASGGALTYAVSGSGSGSATVDPNTGLMYGVSVGLVNLQVNAAGDTDYFPSQSSQGIAIFYSPGAVGAGGVDMQLWLRADNAVLDTGGQVVEWDDQSQSISVTANEPQTVASGSIVNNASMLNYNPLITFDGTQSLSGLANFNFASSGTIVAVARNTLSGASTGSLLFTGNGTGPGMDASSSAFYIHGIGGFGGSVSSSTSALMLIGTYANTQTTSGSSMSANGVVGSSGGNFGISNTASSFQIGQGFTSDLAEVVYYNRGLSAQEQQRVLSYLAIKYGLQINPSTLPDYLASDGTQIWTNASHVGYTSTIIGLGADATSGLNQRQSSTGQVLTMSLGSLAVSNASNGSSFAIDKSFLLVGNNGLTSTLINTTDLPVNPGTSAPMRMRMSQVYMAQNTNNVGAVTLQFDLTGALSSSTGVPYQTSELCLLIDRGNTGSFTNCVASNGSLTVSAVQVGGSTSTIYQFSNIVLNSNDRFTVGLLKKAQTLTFAQSSYTTSVGAITTITADNSATIGSASVVYSLVSTGSGSATLNAATGQLTATLAGTLTLTATAAANSDYVGATTNTTIVIGKGTPTLSISSTTLAMTVGSTATLSSISTPPLVGGVSSTGAISYSILSGASSISLNPLTGQLTAIQTGQVVLQVSQAPDSNYYSPIPVSLTITIGRSTPSLALSITTGASSMVVGGILSITATSIPTPPGGSMPSTGSVSFSVVGIGSGSATIDANTGQLTALASGQVLVTGIQGPDVNYYQSTPGTLTITIGAGPQTVTFASFSYSLIVEQTSTITATNSVSGGGAITYSVSSIGTGSATVNASTGQITATGAGTVTLTAQAAANSNYTIASTNTLLVIGKSTPTLQILSPTAMTVGSITTAVAQNLAVYSSGGSLTFSIAAPGSGLSATVNAVTGQITAIRAGVVTLIVQSAGDTNYNVATTNTLITIGKGTPTLSITSTTLSMSVGSTATVSAVSIPPLAGGVPSTGSITYSIILGISNALIDAVTGQITATASGSIVVQAIQGGDANYNAPVPVSLTITIGAGAQTLALTSSTGNYNMTVGDSLTATASSNVIGGGAITYSISSGSGSATVDVNSGFVTAIGAGTVTLTAATLGNANYTAAMINQTITIGKGTPILSFTNTLTSTTVGGSIVITGLSTSPGILASTGGISYSLLGTGSTNCSIDSSSGVLTGIRSGQVVSSGESGFRCEL